MSRDPAKGCAFSCPAPPSPDAGERPVSKRKVCEADEQCEYGKTCHRQKDALRGWCVGLAKTECEEGSKTCWDGTVVRRELQLRCEWATCPPEPPSESARSCKGDCGSIRGEDMCKCDTHCKT